MSSYVRYVLGKVCNVQFTPSKVFETVLPRAEELLESVSSYETLRATLDTESPWQAKLPVRGQLGQVGLSLLALEAALSAIGYGAEHWDKFPEHPLDSGMARGLETVGAAAVVLRCGSWEGNARDRALSLWAKGIEWPGVPAPWYVDEPHPFPEVGKCSPMLAEGVRLLRVAASRAASNKDEIGKKKQGTAETIPMVCLGNRNYAVGDEIQVVDETEDAILQALIGI